MSLYGMTFGQFALRLQQRFGKGSAAAAEVYRAFFRRGPEGLSSLPVQLRSAPWLEAIAAEWTLPPLEVVHRKDAEDVTKFVSRTRDGLDIESVLVPMDRYATACISSQAGCRMGCRFCETGKTGLSRNLSIAEIVYQVFAARHVMDRPVKNVVFMGMGEPFDNFDAVLGAIDVLREQRGLDIAERNITVSTSGRIDGLNRLAGLHRPHIRLAISLNAPNDAIRSRIMPINRRAPMGDLKAALLAYPLKKGVHIVIEYVLIHDCNDRPEHAGELARYLDGLPVKVNLIPCNPCEDGRFAPPPPSVVDAFRMRLVSEGVFVRLRTPKGRSLMAACGQLGRGIPGCAIDSRDGSSPGVRSPAPP